MKQYMKNEMANLSGLMLFTNARICTPNRFVESGSVLVRDGVIVSIYEQTDETDGISVEQVIDLKGDYLVPGFIDVHVHGGGGFDVMSGKTEDIVGIAKFHAARGTTSFLPTTITADRVAIESAVRTIVQSMERGTGGAEILGIHLEGPFLNCTRCGAQNPEFIRLGTIEELQTYVSLSKGNIRMMTIAPEKEGALDLIRYAVQEGITISIGHSDATYRVMKDAVVAGASHVTHLFNGMRPLHHREPGVVGSALMMDELTVELICDGYHINPDLISLVFRIKSNDKIVLITDAVAAAGCQDGEYLLGSLPVVLKNGQVTLIDTGGLAGSSLTMDQALKNTMKFTNKSLVEIIPTLTLNPARQVRVEQRKGSIELGKDADLVVLNENFDVAATYVRGNKVYDMTDC